MKIDKTEVVFFLAGIVTVTVLVLLYEFSGNNEESQEGSHGVYDHYIDK